MSHRRSGEAGRRWGGDGEDEWKGRRGEDREQSEGKEREGRPTTMGGEGAAAAADPCHLGKTTARPSRGSPYTEQNLVLLAHEVVPPLDLYLGGQLFRGQVGCHHLLGYLLQQGMEEARGTTIQTNGRPRTRRTAHQGPIWSSIEKQDSNDMLMMASIIGCWRNQALLAHSALLAQRAFGFPGARR